jgi:ABC-type transport system involved in multi-copper enzyme maturation permease subunit
MTSQMMAHWWKQILAVIRLEMRKTFFARRGLWVYLLALAPAMLFLGHSIFELRAGDRRQSGRTVPAELARSIEHGMTSDQVREKLGQPDEMITFGRGRGRRTVMRYSDGETDYGFTFNEGDLVSISRRSRHSLQQDSLIFATTFQFFYLRLAIFFGCVGIFMNLFRGEMIDKSLHFYLLAPIRREVLVVGKYLAGLIATAIIFTTSTALQLWAMSIHFDPRVISEYLRGHGWEQVGAYLGVTVLACVGYGSVFLAAGLLFRNPLIPAAAVLLWESSSLFLPAALKKISVIFYLQSLCPVVAPPNADTSPIMSLLISSAEPPPAWLAVVGLVGLTVVVLFIAGMRARKLEINYGTD